MSQTIVCRPACIEDLERILAIESQSFRDDAFSRRQFRYLMQHAKGAFFVAVVSGIVAGYISVLVRSNRIGRIYSLAVDRDCRGKGVAKLLIDAAVDFMRAQCIQRIFLEVAVDDVAAISLYEKKHFIKRSIKPGYYHSGADAYSMMCVIPQCSAATAMDTATSITCRR